MAFKEGQFVQATGASTVRGLSAADFRQALGVVIGTHVQKHSDVLDDISEAGKQSAISDASTSHSTGYASTDAALDALGSKINAILAAMRAQGLIAE